MGIKPKPVTGASSPSVLQPVVYSIFQQCMHVCVQRSMVLWYVQINILLKLFSLSTGYFFDFQKYDYMCACTNVRSPLIQLLLPGTWGLVRAVFAEWLNQRTPQNTGIMCEQTTAYKKEKKILLMLHFLKVCFLFCFIFKSQKY